MRTGRNIVAAARSRREEASVSNRWRVPVLLLILGLVLGVGLERGYRHLSSAERAPAAAPGKTKRVQDGSAAALNREELKLSAIVTQLSSFNGSSIYNVRAYHTYRVFLDRYLGRDAKARVLEIGPGINLGTGLLFAMGGAEKYYGLDIYRDPDLLGAPQYESIVDLMTRIAPDEITRPATEIMKVADGRVSFDPNRVEYLYPHQSYDIPLPDGSVDYIFSNATLEHVTDPMRTVEAFARALRTGGVTAHLIDLRDHRDFSHPLEFLKIDDASWQARYKDPAILYLYMNRWRASDFKAAFEKVGFEILEMRPSSTYPVTEAVRATFQPRFQKDSLEDLSITGLLIVARKK